MEYVGSRPRLAAAAIVACLIAIPSQGAAQAFLRYPGTARMVLVEDGTGLCLYADGDRAVLRECTSMRDRDQIWQIRGDFTIYNEGQDRCIDARDPDDLRLAECDFNDPNQQWWLVKNSSERFEIEQLNDMSQCIVSTEDAEDDDEADADYSDLPPLIRALIAWLKRHKGSGPGASPGDTSLAVGDCDGGTALSFDFEVPGMVPRRTGGLAPPTTGTLKNIREIAPEGFGSLLNVYPWSMVQYRDSIIIGTLNLQDNKGIYLYTEGVDVDSEGAEMWQGKTRDGGKTWRWSPMFKGGLFDSRNIGVRKIINCEDQLLGVYMNNVSGFGLLRYDGEEWSVEFSGGGPGRLANPKNVSARGMAQYKGHVYLGVHGGGAAASIWRRRIDDSCNWAAGSRWEVITDDGLGVDGSGIDPINNNSWFGDMTSFKGYLYVGTLNWAGAQIWRSKSGDRGTWEQVYRAPLVVVSARNNNIFKLIEFQDHLVASTENGFIGAELLVSFNGDRGTWEAPYPRAMTGLPQQRRDNYGWFIGEAFGRLYPFFMSDRPSYRAYAISDITNGEFATETMQAFNTPRLYFGGRTSVEYKPKDPHNPNLLILGLNTPNTQQALRVYAAEDNPDNSGHIIRKGRLPTTNGPRTCISTRRDQTGTLLNNGVAWVDFSAFGSLEVVRQTGAVESTETSSLFNRKLCFHKNGNLAIYDSLGRRLWQTHTQGRGAGMALTPECDFIIFDRRGRTVYSAGTDCDGRVPPP
ncbi:MAG: ricin-type beta-trefoil lectin domain protein [Myxococcota bacterium]